MQHSRSHRKLAAIVSGDVVGYSRLVRRDEEGTLSRVKQIHTQVVAPTLAAHSGRLVKTLGDGFLAEFSSVVDATRWAVEFQQEVRQAESSHPADTRITYRIGIHLGDVIEDAGDIFGDGVNIAARLQELAPPGGIAVSAGVHDQVSVRAAVTFADSGEYTVKNIDEPVHVWTWRSDAVAIAVEPTSAEPGGLGDQPSIAVLPFDNMSSDPEQAHFADGITEDIITTLSQVSNLLVIARNSSFAYKGKLPDVRTVGRELNVRYVLEGSVRRAGTRLRVTAQLVDSTTGAHLWAERYDRQVEDIFDLQDELTREIVIALRLQLTDGEQARIWLRSTENVEAWGYATRGADHIWKGTAADMAIARSLLQRAVACDPKYAKATALIAMTHYYDARFNYGESIEDSQKLAAEFTDRALQIEPDEPYAILMRARVHLLADNFIDAVSDGRLAVEKCPSDALCWLAFARILVSSGQAAEAESAIRRAMRLNPFFPVNYLAVLGDALLHQGDSEKAAEVFREIVRRNPKYISAHLHLAGLYSLAGDLAHAKAEIAEVLNLDPKYRVSQAATFYLSSDRHQKELFLNSLRSAGLPD